MPAHFIEPGVPLLVFWVFVAAGILIQGIRKSVFACAAGILSLPLMMVVTLWRDWLTDEVLAGFHLNTCQKTGIACLREEGRITSGRYQDLTGGRRQTAARDLEDLVKKGLLDRQGERRRTYYVLAKGMTQICPI